MRTFVLDGMERAADIEKGDVDSPEHDTGSRPGRKFIRTNGFHLGILGGSARFPGKRRKAGVLVTVTVLGRAA